MEKKCGNDVKSKLVITENGLPKDDEKKLNGNVEPCGDDVSVELKTEKNKEKAENNINYGNRKNSAHSENSAHSRNSAHSENRRNSFKTSKHNAAKSTEMKPSKNAVSAQSSSSKRPDIKRPLSVGDGNKLKSEKSTEISSSNEDILSCSLNLAPTSARKGSELTRRSSSASALSRIGLQDASVDSVVSKYGNQSYVTQGFRLVAYKAISKVGSKSNNNTIQSLSNFYKSVIQLNLLMQSDGVCSSTLTKAESLSHLCQTVANQQVDTSCVLMDVMFEAAREGAKIVRRHLKHDKIEINYALAADNKFSLSGSVDCLISGKDFLGNKSNNLVLLKMTFEKTIPSKVILELFLYAASLDIQTAYLLTFHVKDSTLALYEFKFKFDQLREFNRGTTRRLICENFYKSHYQHGDYKLTLKDRKDLKM